MSEPLSDTQAEDLREAVRVKYREVAVQPDEQFPYPVGRQSALGLGYERDWLDAVPDLALERFVGVGNPFRIVKPHAGAEVLDLGCGCGVDVFVAARLVGPAGLAASRHARLRHRAEDSAGGDRNIVRARLHFRRSLRCAPS